jgi:hypothetical protein
VPKYLAASLAERYSRHSKIRGFNHEDLHYSSIVSLAKSDIQKLRLYFVETIEKARGTIRGSAEESLMFYSVDLFEVGFERDLK